MRDADVLGTLRNTSLASPRESHSKICQHWSATQALGVRVYAFSVGADRMERNFEPMRKQMETWQRSELTDVTATVVIYEAFVEGRLEAPKHLARSVHDLLLATTKLLRIEEGLHKRVISQDKAVTTLARAIRRSRAA